MIEPCSTVVNLIIITYLRNNYHFMSPPRGENYCCQPWLKPAICSANFSCHSLLCFYKLSKHGYRWIQIIRLVIKVAWTMYIYIYMWPYSIYIYIHTYFAWTCMEVGVLMSPLGWENSCKSLLKPLLLHFEMWFPPAICVQATATISFIFIFSMAFFLHTWIIWGQSMLLHILPYTSIHRIRITIEKGNFGR